MDKNSIGCQNNEVNEDGGCADVDANCTTILLRENKDWIIFNNNHENEREIVD